MLGLRVVQVTGQLSVLECKSSDQQTKLKYNGHGQATCAMHTLQVNLPFTLVILMASGMIVSVWTTAVGWCVSAPGIPPRLKEGGRLPPPGWPSSGGLSYHAVTASYRTGLPPVLRDLSFKLQPGSSCGVVGRTGGGPGRHPRKEGPAGHVLGCCGYHGAWTLFHIVCCRCCFMWYSAMAFSLRYGC